MVRVAQPDPAAALATRIASARAGEARRGVGMSQGDYRKPAALTSQVDAVKLSTMR